MILLLITIYAVTSIMPGEPNVQPETIVVPLESMKSCQHNAKAIATAPSVISTKCEEKR